MTEFLEAWSNRGPALLALQGERATVGRASSNDVVFASDERVSRIHAVIERYANGWCVRDLGSANGTFVNGQRLTGERRLAPGDQISVGDSRLVFRGEEVEPLGATQSGDAPPELTKREREILIALCRPMLSGNPFPQPASVHDLAARFVVSDAAIKFHLASLYNKFGLLDEGESRRVRLANEAVRRRAVTLADLKDTSA
jgi:hypothetical protein